MQTGAPDPQDTLSAVSAGIASGKLSPLDCVEASLSRIESDNGTFGAFLSFDADSALAEAKRAESEITKSGPRGPLHGVPLGVKDLFAVRGQQRTCGSPVYPVETCAFDAHVVHRLREAGAIIVGMTSLNEFAYGPTGINAVSTSPRNPWNLERSCGGSSSGSACAVAAAMVPAALGTDTGGSVRLPAALCGVSGLKPTFGLTSRHGIQPLCASFDHPGPFARTAWDCGLLLDAMAGADKEDPTTWNRPSFRMPSDDLDLRGLRIGVLEPMFRADLTSEVETVFDDAIGDLERFGCVLQAVQLPALQTGLESWSTICLAEAYEVHAERVRDHHDELSPDVASRLLLGRDITISMYQQALRQREAFLSGCADVTNAYDVLLSPTAIMPAVSIETGNFDGKSGTVSGSRMLGKLTRLANQTGQPAISVPCGFTSDGLPVGLQFIGRWFGDAELLQVAVAYQQQTDWHTRRPAALSGA